MRCRLLNILALLLCTCDKVTVKGQRCDPPSSPPFTVTQDSNALGVSINGVQVLHHNASSPMVFVGIGLETVVEDSGNFFITDYVQERVALETVSVQHDSGSYNITLSGASYWVTLNLSPGVSVAMAMTVAASSGNYNRLWLRVPAVAGEMVFGAGEQYSKLNLRGQVYPVWTREQGVGRNKSSFVTFLADQLARAGGDYYTTYFSQPTWMTTRRYLLHYTGSNYAEMDFRHEDFFELLIEGSTEDAAWLFEAQPSLSNLVCCLTAVLGRMRPLPTWLYQGAILGVQGGTDVMLQRLREANSSGMAVRGLWIQDWSGTRVTPFGSRVFWNWQWDQEHYPGLNATIAALRQQDIRVLVYINPNLDSRGSLFHLAQQRGYLVKTASGQPYLVNFGTFRCGTVDLTNPQAYQWYKDDVVKGNLLSLGVGGWMADFGEYLPVDAVLHAGRAPLLHNQWPRLWAQLNHQAVSEMGQQGQDVVFFTRSGFSGSSNATMLMWAGDQNVDWSLSDGEASTVPAALSLGLSGVGLTHFDIGGYTTYVLPELSMVRSLERLLRSAEHAVFGPAFRTHEGNIPQANAQFYSSNYTLQCFSQLVRMFATLAPYHQHVVNITATTGLPAQRPLFLSYPEDNASYAEQYQYLYGDDLLVAPVYLPAQSTWPVYLPPCRPPHPTSSTNSSCWVYLWDPSLTSAGGGRLRVNAPLGHAPAFYHSSSAFLPVFRALGAIPPLPQPPSSDVDLSSTVPSSLAHGQHGGGDNGPHAA